MKKAHLRRRLSSEGALTAPFISAGLRPASLWPNLPPAPHRGSCERSERTVAGTRRQAGRAKPAPESPPCIWTFLISLHSERRFFSTLPALSGTGS